MLKAATDQVEASFIRLFEYQIDPMFKGDTLILCCKSSKIYGIFLPYAEKFSDECRRLLGNPNQKIFIDHFGSGSGFVSDCNTNSFNGNQNQESVAQHTMMQNSFMPQSFGVNAYGNYDPYNQQMLNQSAYYNNQFNNHMMMPNNSIQASSNQRVEQSGNFVSLNSKIIKNNSYRNNMSSQQDIDSMIENDPDFKKYLSNKSVREDKTFENYISDPVNQMVWLTLQKAADAPFKQKSPIYIFGGSGLGKTHLLFALVNRMRKNRPDLSVLYIRADDFIRHYVSSFANKNSEHLKYHFQDMYTRFSVFIIDDIQSLTKAPGSRDAFFDIIAEVIDQQNKLLVLACDEAPGNLKHFHQRLTSRFASGLIVEIAPPSQETRRSIVISKAKEMNLVLDDSIIEFISTRIRSNVREIEGALSTLDNFQRQLPSGQKISYDDAVNVVSCIINSSNQTLSISLIKERVAKEFDVTVEDIDSAKRKANISLARSLAMTLSRELIIKASYAEIGTRSEERRVGKECRSRWSPYH